MEKTNFGAVALAVAIFLSSLVYAVSTRYEIVAAGGGNGVVASFIVDRWTGKLAQQ
jgi:hypothetical protein